MDSAEDILDDIFNIELDIKNSSYQGVNEQGIRCLKVTNLSNLEGDYPWTINGLIPFRFEDPYFIYIGDQHTQNIVFWDNAKYPCSIVYEDLDEKKHEIILSDFFKYAQNQRDLEEILATLVERVLVLLTLFK